MINTKINTIKSEFEKHQSTVREFISSTTYDTDLVIAASRTRAIPAVEDRVATLEKRLITLEDNLERKRNWRINGWLLALTIISTIAALWALFIR